MSAPPPLRKGPLEWSAVDRCLLVGAITVPFVGVYWLLGEHLLRHPDLAPYFDFAAVAIFQRLLAVFIGLWTALMIAAVALRRRAPESRTIVHLTIQLYAIGNTIGAFSVGAVTSPHAFILVGGAAVALVLFDRRAVAFGVASSVLLIVVGAVALSRGEVHYAPLLAAPPYVDGTISPWWVMEMTMVEASVGGALLLLFSYLVRRLRDREARLLYISTTDALTGVANRRHFIDLFDNEFARAQRYGTPLSCVIMDLDHFKRINDRYGHLAGDRVLVAAAQVFKESIRTHDLLARWGGEEFVALLPQTDMAGAEALAERCRGALESATIRIDENTDVKVTTSLGIACHPFPVAASGDELLHRADVALYGAKRLGRNRMHSIPPSAGAAEGTRSGSAT